MKNKRILQIGLGAAVILVLLFVFTLLTDDTRGYQRVDTSVAMQQLADANVEEAQIDDREQRIRLDLREPITVDEREGVEQLITQYPARTAPQVFDAVQASGADKYTTEVTQESFLMSMLGFLLPMLILFGLLFFFLTRMQSGGMFGMGSSKAKELTKDMPTNTFADVAGADEAVAELHEIKDFLQDPTRYEQLGAKIPRGVLLYGPPGTGKTLLARAVAGEAGVPFYSISGSDFVEMFVGVGASRVRDLFKQARENSPCIIFVDEIDAVGRQRGSGMGGGHDEREQTLNQLLVEMDGFGDREGVILMAATNRPDILDPALLRPGRFDRQIPVTNPDLSGREMILNVHSKGKPMGPDADLKALAKRTAGMSGADLANVLNEAALLTARIGGNVITADALEEATDRVIGGPRRESKIISEKEKKVTAYHEGGHTLAAWALKDIERVYKVTILARGRTGGHAMTAAEDDRGMYNRDELYARLVFAMGGRAAEELVFGEPTTGASADIEQATKIARAMLTEYGMSPTLGVVKYGEEQGDPFSGRGGGGSSDYSPAVAAEIDKELRHLLDSAHREAYEILREHRDHLDILAGKLLEKETLRRPDLEVIFDGIEPRAVGEIFPGEDAHFPRQAEREPVKTPVELAIERGEEPPKRYSLLEAAKTARAKRQEELAAQQAAAGYTPVAPDQGPSEGGTDDAAVPAGATTAGRHAAPSTPGITGPQGTGAGPRYGGAPPPPGWTAPGWPPADNPYSRGAAGDQPTGPVEHPGVKNYGSGESLNPTPAPTPAPAPAPEPEPERSGSTALGATDEASTETMKAQTPQEQELVGFRLPDHERPDHENRHRAPESEPEPEQQPASSPERVAEPETTRRSPLPSDADTNQIPRVPDPQDENDPHNDEPREERHDR